MSDVMEEAFAQPMLGRPEPIDVAIIGAGPAGLAAATWLKQAGTARVVVLERESEAGGIPRHCAHPPFGLQEFKRVLTGPDYARRLVRRAIAAGVEIHLATSVVEMRPAGELGITTDQGAATISARRVILATGAREATRAMRLISGGRPLGVLSTGALQSLVNLQKFKPFERPVIVGSELVSFSAILTCRHANIRPVMMIDEPPQAHARWPSSLFPRLLNIPLRLNTRLVAIEGKTRVSAVIIAPSRSEGREGSDGGDSDGGAGERERVACDGVLLTGRFTPEATLARCGHIGVDAATNGPLIDQYGRCSDPAYFAAGNVLRGVETSRWSWDEGCRAASWVHGDLNGRLARDAFELNLVCNDPLIDYVMPQKLSLASGAVPRADGETIPRRAPLDVARPALPGMRYLQLRFARRAKGELIVRMGSEVIWRRNQRVYPQRRVLIPVSALLSALGRFNPDQRRDLHIEFQTAS